METLSFKDRQRAVRARYQTEPATAWVTDHARTHSTDLRDPFHFVVEPKEGSGVQLPVGVHQAVGGVHDAPCPGDILCAALAACQDSSIRLVAHLLGVELTALSVRVTAEVDVRGALAVEAGVPVGFQSLRCDVHLVPRAGTSPELLARLREGAERCCVVLQTLRQPPPVKTVFHSSALSCTKRAARRRYPEGCPPPPSLACAAALAQHRCVGGGWHCRTHNPNAAGRDTVPGRGKYWQPPVLGIPRQVTAPGWLQPINLSHLNGVPRLKADTQD